MTVETLAEGVSSPYLDVTLRPYRSLSPRGFMILMLAIGGTGFLIGLAFLMMGAWPVTGFCGLEILLVYLAFKLNYQAARGLEHLRLTDDGLTITRISPKGEVSVTHLQPNWITVRLDHDADHNTGISLCSRGKAFPIAGFLTSDELESLAARLSAAIRAYRQIPI